MDATVCDADIKYPTDLDLLNDWFRWTKYILPGRTVVFLKRKESATPGNHWDENRQKRSRADTRKVKSDGKLRNAIRLKESLVRASVDMV